MTSPKVSVCVVTYNQENFIETCLCSILEQKVNFPFEVIISDDASTDGTVAILKKFRAQYPDIIRLVLHPVNIGAGINFQGAHDMAVGEYVAHCDGDDFFMQGKLQYQVDFLEKNPEYVQVWHRQYIVDAEDNRIGKFPYRYIKNFLGRKLTLRRLAVSYGLAGQHSSQMYRRSARTVYKNYPATIDYFYALDIAAKGYSTHLNKFLGCYRVGDGFTITTTSHGKIFVEKALADTALFYTEKYNLGKQFFGNLWVRKMVTIYSKEKPSAEFEERFQKLQQYKNILYRNKAIIVYLFLHSSFNLFRIISGYFKILFKRKGT